MTEMPCPYCHELVEVEAAGGSHRIRTHDWPKPTRTHDWPKPTRQVCPGSRKPVLLDEEHDERCAGPLTEDVLVQVNETIGKVGWFGVGVLDEPPYVYTIGFEETWDHAELVVLGLPHEIAQAMLWACTRIVKDGILLSPGEDIEGVLEGFPVRVMKVKPRLCEQVSFGVSDRYYGHEAVRYQLLWPDAAGKFPGEPGCKPSIEDLQRLT